MHVIVKLARNMHFYLDRVAFAAVILAELFCGCLDYIVRFNIGGCNMVLVSSRWTGHRLSRIKGHMPELSYYQMMLGVFQLCQRRERYWCFSNNTVTVKLNLSGVCIKKCEGLWSPCGSSD